MRSAPGLAIGRVACMRLVGVASLAAATTTAAGAPPDPLPEKPAEESRLSTAVFRAGLKKRGLTELLELHVRDFPSASPTETRLMLRDVKLAEYADPSLSPAQRREAVAEANRILEQVIEHKADDVRRFGWLFTLAHSWLYQQAEPFFTNILYRDGNPSDREQLLALTPRAVAVLKKLLEEINDQYDRLDRMSIREFERLEAEGHIKRLDDLFPRAGYLLLWALFYDSLPREDADPVRTSQLNEIMERVSADSALLKTPHGVSRVQVQALLLTGMTLRRLNEHKPARGLLDRSVAVYEQLDDPEEQQRVQWAVTLACMERVRNDRDEGRFDTALAQLARFRDRISADFGNNFGLRVVAALLERSVHRHRAAAAIRDNRPANARHHREEGWKALLILAKDEPEHRDELYAAIYELIGPDAKLIELDPLEQCALIAGLLVDAGQSDANSRALLDRAVEAGEHLLDRADGEVESLIPEVLHNVAVAEYRRGRPAAAARRFLEVGREHPTFGGAPQAAGLAAQLSAELLNESSEVAREEGFALYREALETLVFQHPDTKEGRYWRFHYAQWLDQRGEHDAAARQYALIDQTHEHYLDSTFLRVRCHALALQKADATGNADPLDLQNRTNEFFATWRGFLTQATKQLNREADPDRSSTLRTFLARARLLAAEVQILPHVGRPAQALETLSGFEEANPDGAALSSRVWRVRLLSYEALGRLDEATHVIPAFIAADPENAGATLQSLYLSLSADADRLRSESDNASAQRKAEVALVLARQIHDWAARTDLTLDPADRRAMTVQLAEANLRAGRHDRARELFEPLIADEDPSTPPGRVKDVRVVFGYAEALFQLGEHAKALPEFNRLAIGLPATDPVRWKSLLRDLQCRTALGELPNGIIKVLQQQKHLYPELGGPALAPQFEKLERENTRRLDTGG